MTNNSNPFALACRHLLSKYTISTLQSTDIVDNQDSYECIWKFTRFQIVKKERKYAFQYVCIPPTQSLKASADGIQSQK